MPKLQELFLLVTVMKVWSTKNNLWKHFSCSVFSKTKLKISSNMSLSKLSVFLKLENPKCIRDWRKEGHGTWTLALAVIPTSGQQFLKRCSEKDPIYNIFLKGLVPWASLQIFWHLHPLVALVSHHFSKLCPLPYALCLVSALRNLDQPFDNSNIWAQLM